MAMDDKLIHYGDMYYKVLDSIYCGEGNSYYLCMDLKSSKCTLVYPGNISYVVDDLTHFTVLKKGKYIINRNDIETLYTKLPNRVYTEKVIMTPALISELEKVYGFPLDKSKLLPEDGSTHEMDTYELHDQLFSDYDTYTK